MTGETDLDALFKGMEPVLQDGVHVFATLLRDAVPAAIKPKMQFEEAEGSTLILLREEADAHGLTYEFPCRMITLNIHSALDAVGFLARITTALAAENMGVNPVSGFYHDHLFVPEGREDDAMAVLATLIT